MAATSDTLRAVIADVQGLRGPPGPAGPMGPQGVPGRDGEGAASPGETAGRGATTTPCKSCGALSGSRVVVAAEWGTVDRASALNPEHATRIVGITLHAVSLPGLDVEVITQGVLEDSSLSLIPLKPVYVGSTGGLTQTVEPGWAFVRIVGTALSESRVMLDLMAPILMRAS